MIPEAIHRLLPRVIVKELGMPNVSSGSLVGRYLRMLTHDVGTLAKHHGSLISWKVMKRLKDTVTVNTKMGRFTVLCSDEAIGARLYQQGEFELEFLRRALSLLRELKLIPPAGQGVVLDAGANNGVICIGMLTLGEIAEAIAIEPEPVNFSLLKRNVEQNGLQDRTALLNYAVGESRGELTFELNAMNSGDHRVRRSDASESLERYSESSRSVISVASITLDELISTLPGDRAADISLIWIDVQGYEGYAFRGAKELLSKRIPVVTEVWPYGLRRAGMTEQEFCAIAKRHWSNYWVFRRTRFVKYPIESLALFLEELGSDGDYDNVIFSP